DDINYDWCILTMKENIAVNTGWMGIGYSSKTITNKSITVSGYPYDNKYQGHQCCSKGEIISETEYLINHNANTLPGQSGSPIFDSDGIAWGIHRAGAKTFNQGVRITKELFAILGQKISDATSHYYN
ncbi:MAG: trypsin-like peptidase domain-containing protein, partial [Lachnospiraceae bacterium]|nr:trypsin-like peptidase domain-containing protein [Lachnospiraceae bacterium]